MGSDHTIFGDGIDGSLHSGAYDYDQDSDGEGDEPIRVRGLLQCSFLSHSPSRCLHLPQVLGSSPFFLRPIHCCKYLIYLAANTYFPSF